MSKKFKSQDFRRFKRIGTKWRMPQGSQSKLRIGKKAAGIKPNVGYRTPKAVRYTVNGKKVADVFNANLSGVEKGAAIRIASSVGKKKLLQIESEAKKLGIEILNRGKITRLMKSIKDKKKAEKATPPKDAKAEKK
ncbi:MAG: 50S ribosomal protein L32e [Candidatus Aenigmarchaeota archaeon]|nr:50S ribosomal protein L32e [Candidatus Aenigmarchaeota archaeon]